jgi:hypothetical protein
MNPPSFLEIEPRSLAFSTENSPFQGLAHLRAMQENLHDLHDVRLF